MSTVDKVFDILEVFLDRPDNNLRFSELLKLSRLNKATANRLIKVLMDRGYLNQFEKRGGYSLSTKFLNYARVVTHGIKIDEIAKPYLVELATSVQECVFLCARMGRKLIIIQVIDSKNILRAAPAIGTEVPYHCTGVGKAFLAHLTKPELEEYFRTTELKQFTDNTIIDPNQLRAHLKLIAEEGVAYDEEEELPGIRNVAAPVKDADGKVCAFVGVLGPAIRLTRVNMVRTITPEVKRCTHEISRELGYTGGWPN